MSEYLVKLEPLDDDMILATDPVTGNELLRFGVAVAGQWVKVQFPKFGEYPQFLLAVQEILLLFTADDESIDLPEDMTGVIKHSTFAARELMKLKASLLARRADIGKKVEHTFFKYLRPEVELADKVLDAAESRDWIVKNAGYDFVLNMFAALLVPEELLKKKSLSILKKVYPSLTSLVYSDTSQKSSVGESEPSTAPVLSGYA